MENLLRGMKMIERRRRSTTASAVLQEEAPNRLGEGSRASNQVARRFESVRA
jgi:hypothetical protein